MENENNIITTLTQKIKVLIFFSGFGLSSYAFKKEGYEVMGIEYLDKACEVYRANLPEAKLIEKSTRELTPALIREELGVEPGEIEVAQISFPCTKLSKTGLQEMFHATNDQWFVSTKLALELGIKIILWENVPAICDENFRPILSIMNSFLKRYAPDYKYECRVLDSRLYGDFSSRPRFLLMAVHKSVGSNPIWPKVVPPSERRVIEDLFPEAVVVNSSNFGVRSYMPHQHLPTITGHPSMEIDDGKKVRQFTPRDYANAMGLPEDFNLLDGVISIQDQKLGIGNGMCISITRALAKSIMQMLGHSTIEEVQTPEPILSFTESVEEEVHNLLDNEVSHPLVTTPSVDQLEKGYVIYQGKSMINGSEIVGIVTMKSLNPKTGNMCQLWILNAEMPPLDAASTGADISICGKCSLRKSEKHVCYVNIGLAPTTVYKSWKKGIYPKLKNDEYTIFSSKSIRFGSYGDPLAIPLPILNALKKHAQNYTSYTHQWKTADKEMQSISMASVDNLKQKEEANNAGWRTFRIIQDSESPVEGEIMCPNITSGVQCVDCNLCVGLKSKANNIAVPVHGSQKSNFNVQIPSEEISFTPTSTSTTQPLISSDDNFNFSIISTKKLMELEFEQLDFTGEWLNLLGEPAKVFHLLVYGLPGQGKSTFSVQLGKHLADTFGKVLYCSGEEGISKTFKDKFKDAVSENFDVVPVRHYQDICDAVPQGEYQFLIIDSLDTMKIGPSKLRALKQRYSDSALITVSQSTKDGNMRGSQELMHDSDIAVEVDQGVATTIKNRFKPAYQSYVVFENEAKAA